MSDPARRLTHQRVVECYGRCAAPAQKRLGVVTVRGIVAEHTLVARRLELEERAVREMLEELPDGFRAGPEAHRGGGSVAQMVVDRHGIMWTQDLAVVERLVVLAIATRQGRFVVEDRAKWARLPGGFPYFCTTLRTEGGMLQ